MGLLGKALYNQFTDSLGSPHNIRRTNRFICRNQNHLLCPKLIGSIRNYPCSKHIVLNCFIGAYFHKRNMLMRRCMEHKIRTIFLKNRINPFMVPYRTNQHQKIQIRMSAQQFILYLIRIILIDIQNNQLSGRMQCQLPANLTSNGPPSTCYKNDLSADIIHNLLCLQIDRFPAKQVFDLNFPQHGYADFFIHKLIKSRQSQNLAGRCLTNLQKFLLSSS